MKVSVRVPNRIDFAGGTLDLYPLYLFFEGGITVNAGISVYSYVDLETRDDSEIHIHSLDLGETEVFSSLKDMPLEGPTKLVQRVLKSYRIDTGLTVKTRNEAPQGSGLGASSALLIALSAALITLQGSEIDITSIIDRGAAIEAGLLGIPTGKQDYYGAVLGRIHALHFDETGCLPEPIPINDEFREALDGSLIVSFTGISHYSGATNWDMLKMVIERTGNAYENLAHIKETAYAMRDAFQGRDLREVGNLVNREWSYRKDLAPGVTTDFINEVIQAVADAGAWGSKLCGAGGGGCMITLAPPDKREEIIKILEGKGIKVMPAGIDYEGMNITCQYD